MVAIVTGGSSGIGFHAAKDLASRGAKVIVAARNQIKGENAVKEMVEKNGNLIIRFESLNLASLKSVREFAERVNAAEVKIDILINNAGMIETNGRIVTEDGLEVQTQTNHYGHFMLTILLLQNLKKSAGARIVIVSSNIHKIVKLQEFRTNFSGEIAYSSLNVFGNTNLANILFSKELARRLRGTRILVNAGHPGIVPGTNFLVNATGKAKFLSLILRSFGKFFFKTNEEGAQTMIYLAVDENVEGISGQYFLDCKISEASPLANDTELAKEIWSIAERITDVKFES